MAKMTFERLRARVLPCVSETANINKTEVISPSDQEGRQTEDITLDAATYNTVEYSTNHDRTSQPNALSSTFSMIGVT